jgi:hypothetical protein
MSVEAESLSVGRRRRGGQPRGLDARAELRSTRTAQDHVRPRERVPPEPEREAGGLAEEEGGTTRQCCPRTVPVPVR